MEKLLNKYPFMLIVFIVIIGIIEASVITSILQYCNEPSVTTFWQVTLFIVALLTIPLAYKSLHWIIMKFVGTIKKEEAEEILKEKNQEKEK